MLQLSQRFPALRYSRSGTRTGTFGLASYPNAYPARRTRRVADVTGPKCAGCGEAWYGTDDVSRAMNRMPKLVASRTRPDLSAWENSSLMSGELLDAVEKAKADRDVITTGSASIVHALTEHDKVDEYRILFFPTALGAGVPLLSPEAAPVQLRLLSAEASGPAILARYARFAR
jgi:dihydrofolate reductase